MDLKINVGPASLPQKESQLADERFAFILNNTNELKELLKDIEALIEQKAKLLVGELPDSREKGAESPVPDCWVDETTTIQGESLSVARNIFETLRMI